MGEQPRNGHIADLVATLLIGFGGYIATLGWDIRSSADTRRALTKESEDPVGRVATHAFADHGRRGGIQQNVARRPTIQRTQ